METVQPHLDPVVLGKMYIGNGWLKEFMKATGVSRAHVARMINVMPPTVNRWANGNTAQVANISARKVHDLAGQYLVAQAWLDSEKLQWSDVTPFHLAAMNLGKTVGELERCVISRGVLPIDFGMMGQWLTRADVELCRGR